MTAPKMSRRQVLLGLAAAGTSAAAAVLIADRIGSDEDDASTPATTPAAAPSTSTTGPSLPPVRPVTPVEGVARVGEVYLATRPDPGDVAGLRAALPELTAPDAAGMLGQFPALGTRIGEDFAAGRIEVLEGWVLARTEVQAAALVALLA